MQKATQCVHSGTHHDELTKGVNTPIYTSTAYHYEVGEPIAYPRYFNTINQNVVAQKIAKLENAEAGLVFASGMAAVMNALLGVLRTGDHLILQNNIYGGTHYAVREHLGRLGIETSFVEGSKAEDFEAKLQSNTKAVYIETPSNPLLSLVDIEEIATWAKQTGLTSLIDNTFATPILQNPILLGIDISIHSGTKYLAGHSDLSCGVVVSSKEWMEKIHQVAYNFGANLDNVACALLERSIKTLALRIKTQSENALQIAQALSEMNEVKAVYYPGLTSHQDYHIAKKQMSGGFGAMLSFELHEDVNDLFMNNLKLISKALSLGGVESTITEPAHTSHSKMTEEMRANIGISNQLFRLSVGIEDAQDLIEDLKNALKSIKQAEVLS